MTQRPDSTSCIQRLDVLGVEVSAINLRQAVGIVERWIARREQHYVCVTNVHCIMEAQRDEAFREILNRAGLVTPDGMPLVWLSWLKGVHHVQRVYGPDLMLALCGVSVQRGYRHFFYGGDSGVAQQMAERLQASFVGLSIVGCMSPPFRALPPDEDEEVVRTINGTNPDIVWVGLGAPKQERWMADHLGRVSAPVMIGVGAAFDFHAGVKNQAPPWMRRHGLEWLFRLLSEPRRLGPRYLTNNPRFVWRVLLDAARQRRQP